MAFNSEDFDGNKVPVAVQHTATGDDVQLVQIGVGPDNAVVPADSSNPLQVAFTSQPVGNTTDSIAATLMTGAVVTPALGVLSIKYKPIVASSSGATTIVAAVTAKKIRVLGWELSTNASVNVKWQSHITPTDLTGLYYCVGNAQLQKLPTPFGYFETVAGEALDINLSGAVAVGGDLVYCEV